MPSCAVPTCRNAVGIKKKQDGITFHLFPSDPIRKAKWTKIIRKTRLNDSWKPGASSLICSAHFDEKYFYDTKCGLKKISKEAFPNKNLAIPIVETEPHKKFKPFKQKQHVVLIKQESESSAESSGPSQTKNDKPLGDKPPHSPTQSDSEIGDVDVSDSDSIFDTPVKHKLKTQLHRKEMLCKKYCKQIKTLHQKNRRLTKRLVSLKNTLKIISAGKLYETSYAEASAHT